MKTGNSKTNAIFSRDYATDCSIEKHYRRGFEKSRLLFVMKKISVKKTVYNRRSLTAGALSDYLQLTPCAPKRHQAPFFSGYPVKALTHLEEKPT